MIPRTFGSVLAYTVMPRICFKQCCHKVRIYTD